MHSTLGSFRKARTGATVMKSRRSILGALGTLPALTLAGSVERSCADTTLLALGTRFEELAAKFDADIDDMSEDMIREFGHIELEILATGAVTVEGLRVKARAACWALLGDLDPAGEATCDKRMALSIVRDLIRLYDSHLERPGALEKLVAECTKTTG